MEMTSPNPSDISQPELAQVQPDAADRPVAVAVRSGSILATAFHPELTRDPRWHELFLRSVAQQIEDGRVNG